MKFLSKLIALAVFVFNFTVLAAPPLVTTPTDTSFIGNAVARACIEILKIQKQESREIFFDFEDCDYTISSELVDGHLEADLLNAEYLARAIEMGYHRISNQHEHLVSKE